MFVLRKREREKERERGGVFMAECKSHRDGLNECTTHKQKDRERERERERMLH